MPNYNNSDMIEEIIEREKAEMHKEMEMRLRHESAFHINKINDVTARCKRMNRIAEKLMEELIASKRETFILMRDEEIREWWQDKEEFDKLVDKL